MMAENLQLIIMGPPGSGKGTQSVALARDIGSIHISTGDLFRYHERLATPLGVQIQDFIKKGDLVPDDITITMLKDKIESLPDSVGYILDGFPRTLNQAIAFDKMLIARDSRLDLVICIDVPDKQLEDRLLGRIVCEECSLVYGNHVDAEYSGYCKSCGGKLHKRVDDSDKEVIGHRLKKYQEFSLPIMDHYQEHGVLHRVDGTGLVSEVTDAIKKVVANTFKGTLSFNY